MTASPIVLIKAPEVAARMASRGKPKCSWTSWNAFTSPIRSDSAVDPVMSVNSSVISVTPSPSPETMNSLQGKKSRNYLMGQQARARQEAFQPDLVVAGEG